MNNHDNKFETTKNYNQENDYFKVIQKFCPTLCNKMIYLSYCSGGHARFLLLGRKSCECVYLTVQGVMRDFFC